MPAYVYNPLPVFTNVLNKAQASGRVIDYTTTSDKWLQKEITSVSASPNKVLGSVQDRLRGDRQLMIGNMYLFAYDPKHKKTLPYYDRFPLIIPVDSIKTGGKAGSSAGFMGINFHYLHPTLRARLLDGLYSFVSNDKMDATTRIQVSYELLKKTSKLRWFKPCVKQYLFSHMKSRFLWIDPKEWNMAVFLKLARFQKASEERVYKESAQKI